jgi:hypothetical protein
MVPVRSGRCWRWPFTAIGAIVVSSCDLAVIG